MILRLNSALGLAVLDPFQLDFLGVWDRVSVDADVFSLDRDGVRINECDDLRRRCLLGVWKRHGGLDGPLLPVLSPHPFAEAAGRVEIPRTDALGHRVPADPYLEVAERKVPEGRRESSGDEVLI